MSLALVLGVSLIAIYFIVRAASPKPIPGIPYVSASAKKTFGDIPDALKYTAKTSEILSFLRTRCVALNSPIVQVFMKPFGRPWVVVCDAREAQDILTHRTREFDRSDFFREIFSSTTPHNQVLMRTNEVWKANRRLVADVVSPHFLKAVAGPSAHNAVSGLIKLWCSKEKLASGHPFEVADDMDEMMLDAIFSIAFGPSERITDSQNNLLSEYERLDRIPEHNDAPVVFPSVPWPRAKEAVEKVTTSAKIPMSSPLGRWHHQFALKFYPSLRAAVATKNRLLREKLDAAWEKFNNPDSSDDDIECATDLIVKREVKAAQKEGRKPVYDSPTIQDEIFGILEAGHDTSSTSLQWGVKFLTENQDVQQKLRSSLRTTFARAAEDNDVPTAEEVYKTHTPYLDAVIDEILRCGGTAAANMRVTTSNTEILGHQIPAGTDVFLLTSGPSYDAAPFPVEEAKRSKTSQEIGEKNWSGNWEVEDLDKFLPERWLVVNEKGETDFDERAGPMHIFGGGVRGCFGRRLAKLAMRIMFTMILWNFQLEPLPTDLSDMAAMDVLSHRPQKTFVRLGKPCVDETLG